MLTVIILAAGKGTRMKSDKPKVLFEAAGKPMIEYAVEAAKSLNPNKILMVVGNGAEAVKEHFKNEDIEFCLQSQQLGTGDAVRVALGSPHMLKEGKALILCGDMPLLKSETLKIFIEKSEKSINFISAKAPVPKGYGRVIRASGGAVMKIVEEKDANENEKKINEINTGVYLCEVGELSKRLENISNNNAQEEYYLTDIVASGSFAYLSEDYKDFMGVNDRLQLAEVSQILWQKRAEKFMKDGVSIIDPKTFYADEDVEIESDCLIYPNVFLEKGSKIGKNCTIYQGSRIIGSIIWNDCEIMDNSLVEDSHVGSGSRIGPMAHLRPGSVLEGDNKVGNFVELKKTKMGKGSKASHLTYLGDAELGKDVNIGCGTITCNYDGFNKFKTIIGDGVFVGSDVQFVAPIEVGSGALVAAGTTVTKNIPGDALAIARCQQENLEGRGKILMERNRDKKK